MPWRVRPLSTVHFGSEAVSMGSSSGTPSNAPPVEILPLPANASDRPEGIPSPGSDPFVSVVVSHLNSARTIKACLESVLAQRYPRNRYEVIVVDAGSTDGSIDIVKNLSCPNLTLVVLPGCSEASGQTEGVRLARGSIIFFTNSDIYVPTDWIGKHVEWHRKGFGLTGGSVFWGGDKYGLAWNIRRLDRPVTLVHPGVGIGFSNCSVGKALLIENGGLRDLRSQHDTEFALRFVSRGGRLLLDPSIQVYHDHPFKSLKGCILRSYRYSLNHIIVMRTIEQGEPARQPLVSAIDALRNIALELVLVNGVIAYREVSPTARSRGIDIGLVEFMLIHMVGREISRYLGLAAGFLRPRPSAGSVRDLHSSRQSPQ
jgi:Glycosyl transferase family 2